MTPTADINCETVLGAPACDAMQRGLDFLKERSATELLGLVGQTFPELALRDAPAGKGAFPTSYGGGKPCGDDLLAGLGMFYVTEAGKLMLDCTAGHYQMTWGYNHPALSLAVQDAMRLGVVWDNHSNIPSLPVKMLADELLRHCGDAGLDRAMLGVCTGSVACSTALKIMLARYADSPDRASLGSAVVIALDGNYHGTDLAAQTMRGMWPGLVRGMETVLVQPNDPDELAAAFAENDRRVVGFWAEPIMMNREAIAVDAGYLQEARRLCTEHGALMALDEIQTGFWCPEVFAFRRLGIAPDMVVVGKGMTAGFHPLAGLLYRSDLDILAQYDAISTNGNASLAAFVGLCNMRLIDADGARLAALAQRQVAGLQALAGEFPDLIQETNGDGFLNGLKFCAREDALGCQRAAVERGLWLRAHAYHEGHRTLLMKFPLVVTEEVIDYVLGGLRELLTDTPWR